MNKLYSNRKHLSILQNSILFIFIYPEILFSLFLIPTKFASLTQKLNIPSFVSPPNVLFAFISCLILIHVLMNEKFISIPKWLFIAYTGFILLMVTSIHYSSNPEYGLIKTIEFLTYSSLACFAPFFLFRDLISFERFLKTFIVLGIILSVFIFISSPYSFQFYSSNTSYPEFQTTIGSNYLALQYLVGISILIMLYYFLFKKNISKKITLLFIALIGLSSVAMLYSPGKNPIISLFLTVVIMTLASLKIDYQKILIKRKILNYAVFIFVMGSLLLSTVGWMFVLRLQAVLTPGYYGQVERVENTKIAIDLFLSHPILGAGIGSFSDYAAEFEDIERMKYPHNLPLEIASELGSIGLLLFTLILTYAFKQLIYLTKKYRATEYHHLPNAVMAFLVFTFLTSLTGGNINNSLLFVWIGTAFIIEPVIKKCMKNNNSLAEL